MKAETDDAGLSSSESADPSEAGLGLVFILVLQIGKIKSQVMKLDYFDPFRICLVSNIHPGLAPWHCTNTLLSHLGF